MGGWKSGTEAVKLLVGVVFFNVMSLLMVILLFNLVTCSVVVLLLIVI